MTSKMATAAKVDGLGYREGEEGHPDPVRVNHYSPDYKKMQAPNCNYEIISQNKNLHNTYNPTLLGRSGWEFKG